MVKTEKLPQSEKKIKLKNKNPERGLRRFKERLKDSEENEKLWSEIKTSLLKERMR